MLDIRTLFFVMILVSLALAASLWIGLRRQGRAGLMAWIASLLLQCVVFALLAARGQLADMWTIVLPNGLVLICISLKAEALLRFHGKVLARSWHVLPPLALMVFFALMLEHVLTRMLIGSVAYAFGQITLAWLAWRLRVPATTNATWLLVIAYVIGALAFIGRAVLTVVAPAQVSDLLGPSQYQSVSLSLGIIAIIMSSVGFMLLFKEKAEDTAQREAATDPLTGTFNRRMFLELGAKEIARCIRTRQPMSLIMLDLDHFKKVNDKHGHAAGDTVLRRFVEVTAGCLRREDLLFRHGGEEFCVLVPEVGAEGASALAERIRSAVQLATFSHDNTNIPVTVSIGTASLRENEGLDALLNRADEALYAAKHSGRNRVVIYPENAALASLIKLIAKDG